MPRRHRRTRRSRRCPALVVAAVTGAALLAGCGSFGDSGRSGSRHDPAAAAASTGTPDPPHTATPTPSPTPPPPQEPGGGRWLFPMHRLVMYYGAAGTAALGTLGDGTPEQAWSRLAHQAAAYDQPGVTTVPTFELIADVEQGSPGGDGSYSARVPDRIIQHYYDVAHAHGGMLVLDIQPGRKDFLPLAKDLEPWLRRPDVGLALDPEWKLVGDQVPDRQIGHTDATSVNAVSAWLEALVERHQLPQKLLLVHDFTGDMVDNQPSLQTRPSLALVLNMDGFGGRAVKLAAYHRLAADPRVFLGLKLFYHQDVGTLSPTDVLHLAPVPDVVDYQ